MPPIEQPPHGIAAHNAYGRENTGKRQIGGNCVGQSGAEYDFLPGAAENFTFPKRGGGNTAPLFDSHVTL